MGLGISFRPSHRRVELKPNDESDGVNVDPKLNNHEGADRAIELVVAAEISYVDSE